MKNNYGDYDPGTLEDIIRRKRARQIAAKKRKRRNRITAIILTVAFCLTAVFFHKCNADTALKGNPDNSDKTDSEITESEPESDNDTSSPDSEIDTSKTDDEKPKEETIKPDTVLYSIDRDTPYYDIPDNGKALFDYSDGTIDGLYTGHLMPETPYDKYIDIDYKNQNVLIPKEDAVPIDSAKVLPLGVISQITESDKGFSACGVACLFMMNEHSDKPPKDSKYADYESLLNYAEINGYADQGSLLGQNGGMTAGQLQQLALDMYGTKLDNKYSDKKLPSEVLKSEIDNGKQAIVLCKQSRGKIRENDGYDHFIVVTGYYISDNKIYFIYGDSYYDVNVKHGNPLKHISADLLDKSINADFNEPNAILCDDG
jgi:hypothetical protein